jgi:hypothetical protein
VEWALLFVVVRSGPVRAVVGHGLKVRSLLPWQAVGLSGAVPAQPVVDMSDSVAARVTPRWYTASWVRYISLLPLPAV